MIHSVVYEAEGNNISQSKVDFYCLIFRKKYKGGKCL